MTAGRDTAPIRTGPGTRSLPQTRRLMGDIGKERRFLEQNRRKLHFRATKQASGLFGAEGGVGSPAASDDVWQPPKVLPEGINRYGWRTGELHEQRRNTHQMNYPAASRGVSSSVLSRHSVLDKESSRIFWIPASAGMTNSRKAARNRPSWIRSPSASVRGTFADPPAFPRWRLRSPWRGWPGRSARRGIPCGPGSSGCCY